MHECADSGTGCLMREHGVPVFGNVEGQPYDVRDLGCHGGTEGHKMYTNNVHPDKWKPKQKQVRPSNKAGSCAL